MQAFVLLACDYANNCANNCANTWPVLCKRNNQYIHIFLYTHRKFVSSCVKGLNIRLNIYTSHSYEVQLFPPGWGIIVHM